MNVAAAEGTQWRPRSKARAMRPARAGEPRLECRITLADGRVFDGSVPPVRHRALQLGMLHRESEGLVELTPGTRPPGGKLEVDRRRHACHYLPAGCGARTDAWLRRLLEHAERIVRGDYAYKRFPDGPREEVFVGVAPRTRPEGGKRAVESSLFLWVDVDKPDKLPALWDLLSERPCHLLIASAGSGGVHAYWKLDRPLPAQRVDEQTGELIECIERANLRLIHRLGSGPDGTPTVADRQCAEQARVMRLAGTINHKTGEYARIMQADFAIDPYSLSELVGDLPDPPGGGYKRYVPSKLDDNDPYRRIPAVEYMVRIAGREANRAGYVRCPSPAHTDEHPSCSVRGPHPELWLCQACGAGGSIYDLASLQLGGPTGKGLREDSFKAARALVVEVFGELR